MEPGGMDHTGSPISDLPNKNAVPDMSAQLERCQGYEGQDARQNPQSDDYFGFSNAHVLQIMVQRGAIEDSPSKPFDAYLVLDLAADGFCNEKAPKEREQHFLLEEHRCNSHGPPNGE